MCKIHLKIDYYVKKNGCKKAVVAWGGGCALASILLSTLFLPYGPYGKMWSTIKFKLMARNALLYIKKELNVKTRIFPRSSFRSVPFVKKGIVKKKRNRYCIAQFL